MASDIELVKVGDHCTVVSGFAFKSKDLGSFGIPVIKIKNVNNKTVDISDTQFFPKELISEKHDKFFVQNGDVLIAMTGQGSVGRVGRLRNNHGRKILLNQRVGKFSVKPSLDLGFLYYVLSSDQYENILFNAAIGSGQPNLSPSNIYNIEIPYLDIKEQKAIAYILGSLDDKIELNRQMNETLEAMAQAFFKSWFVDFNPVIDNALAAGKPIPDGFVERAKQRKSIKKKDNSEFQSLFPDEFEFTEEMGWIPKGWEVTALAALIKLTGGGTPKTSVEEYWNGDIPWFSVVDAPSQSDVFVIDTEKHVTSLGVEKSSTKILPVGTTIISARGTVGKCAMVSRPMAMNQSCYGVSGKEGVSNTFVYYSVFLSVSELQSKGHGSVFNTITGDTFKSINLAFSGGRLTREFDDLVNPYFEKILANSLQAKTLSKLRDTLLPKLMSGELRIPDDML